MISPKPETALEFSLNGNNSGSYVGYVAALHEFLGGMYKYFVLQVVYVNY